MDLTHRKRYSYLSQSLGSDLHTNTTEDYDDERKTQTESVYVRMRKIPAIGIMFALLAAFFNASGNLLVKLVHDLHAVQIAVIRSAVQVIVFVIFILFTRKSFRTAKGEAIYLFVRCIVGFMAVICVFVSLRMIPLGDSSAITYSAPVLVTVIARVYLKEKCDTINVIALMVTASGVILITKPSFLFPNEGAVEEENRLVGCLFALGGAFGTALSFVALRKLQNTASAVVVFWNASFTVIVGTIILLSINEFKMVYGFKNILVSLSVGFCGLFSQLCGTIAFKLEEAGPVSLTRTFSIVIAFVYQVFVLNEEIEWSSLVGALVVLLSVVSLSLRKWILYKHKTKSSDSSDVENVSTDKKI